MLYRELPHSVQYKCGEQKFRPQTFLSWRALLLQKRRDPFGSFLGAADLDFVQA